MLNFIFLIISNSAITNYLHVKQEFSTFLQARMHLSGKMKSSIKIHFTAFGLPLQVSLEETYFLSFWRLINEC